MKKSDPHALQRARGVDGDFGNGLIHLKSLMHVAVAMETFTSHCACKRRVLFILAAVPRNLGWMLRNRCL